MNLKSFLLLTVSLLSIFISCISQDTLISLEIFPPRAKFINDQLNVEWKIPAEKNVKQYNIEVSKDGTTFTKAGTVLSKAREGDSTSPLTYTITSSATGLLAGAGLVLLPFLGFFARAIRRNRIVYIPAIALVSIVALVGCQKSSMDKTAETDILYLRVAQVDYSNNARYSFVVKVQ